MKSLKSLVLMSAMIAGASFFASCGGNEGTLPEPNPDPIIPVEPEKNEAMTAVEQKEYLEEIALEFMDLMPSSDFKDMADLFEYISDTYGEDYDWDNVEDWAEDAFEATRVALGTKTTEDHYWGTDIYTNYKAVLRASNFTGHFTAQNGEWKYSEAKDLQFLFTDKAGKDCVMKLETSGDIKNVYITEFDEWTDGEGNTDYYDLTQCYIGVPEKIVVTLTQGGKQVVKTTMNIGLSKITDEHFDLSKGNLSFSADIELNNGYSAKVSQVAYSANSNVSAAFSFGKNGRVLVSSAVSSDLSGIPSCNADAFVSDDFDIDDYNTDDATAKNALVKLDILGKLQIQGSVLDVRKFVKYLNDADDNDEKESQFKSYINQANSLIDVNLFYDGKSTKQASVKLEPFYDYYWTTEPVLIFYDGSSYSTFEAFFNDSDFKNVIDTFKKLADKYADLVDEEIYW